ncbi:MAG: type II secretion system F family protein [Candidatus Moranbacteria bacterium]|jgi:type IV pilus assembly protein PilC|nr:type II secretion system F family protein [Candidatus Moranbacteria bacterium]
MPKFLYVAKNYDGETKTGEVVAKDEQGVAQQLKADGFLVTSVREMEDNDGKVKVAFMDRFTKIALKDKMMFARNLSVMISSGLTVSKSIRNLADQTDNKKLSQILLSIYEDIKAGKNLSDGMAKYPSVFNELFVNMVKIGETGGNLDETLTIISIQLEKENALMSKVRGALMYPAVIMVAMGGVAVLMLTYVLPQMTGVFKDMDVELPKSTQFIIGASDLFKEHSVLVLISFVAIGIIFKIVLKTKLGKKFSSFAVLRMPAIKNIVIKTNCARFSRIYSSLLRSGVTSLDALKIVENTLSNYYYKKALRESVKQIQKGVDLSKVIGENEKIFPVLVKQMIEVGEQTGETEVILVKMAEFYEDEVNQVTKNISSIIEPVLMLFMGIAVGFFAISMLQPMYGLMENIK